MGEVTVMPYAEAFATWHSYSVKRGAKEEMGVGDALCWLSAIHVAQLQAGELYDHEAWKYFADWYQELSL
jgi:hypothetical protein